MIQADLFPDCRSGHLDRGNLADLANRSAKLVHQKAVTF
jgi:Zn-finger nucleic acid-binding protein